MSRPVRYDAVARLLHWLIVVLVVTQYLIGWIMPDVHRDTLPVGLIAAHLAVGTALLAAMACRVLWRATHRPPASELSPVMQRLSGLTHGVLYLLLIVVPLLGWINASSRAWRVSLLGAVDLPSLSAAGSAFGHAMGDVHGVLAWMLLAVIGIHLGAALLHHLVLRDGVLKRMLPW
ncbi:cytochrome b [Burkholderia plantarii]|uniref:cytochrome b n=1 Tax=Burkholderia plantarii TaxID=41899 RepID=UPI0018DC155D|nr:cytochrome b [Burkholderia plantarii]MBI0329660.1 cytochrome b [Burkholderia plantarii]